MSSDHFENKLKKVGLSLIIVGLIDIGILTICLFQGIPYFSSFNFFALISGLILIKSVNVKFGRIIGTISSFLITVLLGIILILLIHVPFRFWITYAEYKLENLMLIISFFVINLSYLVWINLKLTGKKASAITPENNNRIADFFLKTSSGYIMGCFLVLLLLIITVFIYKNENTKFAIKKAKNHFSTDYDYFVSSYQTVNGVSEITITAFNDSKIESFEIKIDNKAHGKLNKDDE